MPFLMNSTPTGWLQANGDSVPNGIGTVQGQTANYSALYTLLGTTYGTAGKLPDLRGYFIRGAGTNSIDSTASGTFGAMQADTLKDHSHDYTHLSVSDAGNDSPDGNGKRWPTITGTTAGVKSPNNGGTETRPKNIAMLYCIKY